MEDRFNSPRVVMMLTGVMALLVGADLVTDRLQGAGGSHLILEGLLLGLSGGGFLWGMRGWVRDRETLQTLRRDLKQIEQEKERWQREAHQMLAGLSVQIERQFCQWKLTQAEMEVGFLLLKGFSLKEIAELRRTRPKTVQQQAQAIYQKTGLGSRSELAAFFLEDLLPPREPVARERGEKPGEGVSPGRP